MLMVTIGVYFDSIFKLVIIALDYTQIDVKCTLAIAARVVFYYVAFIFILVRIQRVHMVNKLNEEICNGPMSDKGNSVESDPNKKVSKRKEQQKLQKYRKEKIEEARMQREERIITSHCVNIIVPFAMLGLFANFIPWFLILIPLEEADVCWFYFLTRSPYQLDYIEPWIYTTANVFRFTIWIVELGFLIYFVYQISFKNLKMNQINIKTESILITCEWLVLTVIFMNIKIFQKV